MRSIPTDIIRSVVCVCLSVCLCVGHTGDRCRTAEPTEMLFEGTDYYEPKETLLQEDGVIWAQLVQYIG